MTRRVLDGKHVLTETDDAGVTEAVYTLNPKPHALVVSLHRDSESHFPHGDGHHNVTELTDNTQTVTDEYRYTAHGQAMEQDSAKPPEQRRTRPARIETKTSGQLHYVEVWVPPGIAEWTFFGATADQIRIYYDPSEPDGWEFANIQAHKAALSLGLEKIKGDVRVYLHGQEIAFRLAVPGDIAIDALVAVADPTPERIQMAAAGFVLAGAGVYLSKVDEFGDAGGGARAGRGADDVRGPRKLTNASEQIRSVNLKGWKKGKGAEHFAEHGAEMGFQSQVAYTNAAKALAKKTDNVVEGRVGNTLFKFDKDTDNILIVNAKDRVIKTFAKRKLQNL